MTNEQRMQCAGIITSKASNAAEQLVRSGAALAQRETSYVAEMLQVLKPIADITLDQNAENALCSSVLSTVRNTQKSAYMKATKISHVPLFGKMCKQSFYDIFEALGWEVANQLYLLKMREGAAATSDC